VRFEKRPAEGRADVVATRDIAPGEELFADYGKRYHPRPRPCPAARSPAASQRFSQQTRNLFSTPPRRSLRGAEAATGWPRGSRDSRPPRSTERRAGLSGGADAASRRASRAARWPRRAACAQCIRASVCPAFDPPTCAPPRARARSPEPRRPRGRARRLTCLRPRRSPLQAPAPAPSPRQPRPRAPPAHHQHRLTPAPSPRQPRPRAPPAHHQHRLTPPAGLRLSRSARRPRGAAQGRAGRCLLGAAAAKVELVLVPLQRTEGFRLQERVRSGRRQGRPAPGYSRGCGCGVFCCLDPHGLSNLSRDATVQFLERGEQ
jgi:hypothetical protein